jgi:hypothetical protein
MQSKALSHSQGRSNQVPTPIYMFGGLEVYSGQDKYLKDLHGYKIQQMGRHRALRFLVELVGNINPLLRCQLLVELTSKGKHDVQYRTKNYVILDRMRFISAYRMIVRPHPIIRSRKCGFVKNRKDRMDELPVAVQ